MSKKTITIRTTKGDQRVPALVFGTWAVHEALEYRIRARTTWAITHVESGMCVPPFYTEDLSKATAIRVVKALDEKFPAPEHDEKTGRAIAELLWKIALGKVES